MSTVQKLLSKKEAAQYLGISQRTLDIFRQRENLPSHVIGGKLVRFVEAELERWALGRNAGDGNDEQMERKDNGAE